MEQSVVLIGRRREEIKAHIHIRNERGASRITFWREVIPEKVAASRDIGRRTRLGSRNTIARIRTCLSGDDATCFHKTGNH